MLSKLKMSYVITDLEYILKAKAPRPLQVPISITSLGFLTLQMPANNL